MEKYNTKYNAQKNITRKFHMQNIQHGNTTHFFFFNAHTKQKQHRQGQLHTTCIQHKIHTTQKIQNKVGVLGADLEAWRRSCVSVQKITNKIGETS